MTKIFVTGGAGFIGSNLALELERHGDEVVVADNLISGDKGNISGSKAKFVKLDVSMPFELKEKFDIIHHQASITDPRFGNDDEMLRNNIDGFKNIIKLAIKNNAKLVYASSASVYGNGAIPMKEEQKKDIMSVYSKSKLMMDEIASEYFGKMHIVGLRYFNVFGPRESHKGRPASMIYHLSQQIKSGKNPRIFKWGEQKRDHIYVKDAVDATIMAANAKKSGVFNIGTGIATTFNELVNLINNALSANLKPEYFDNPYGKNYQSSTQANTANAEKFLGFKSKWKLQDGIKDYMKLLYKN